MNRYTYRVEWSSEYGEYVGRCLELPWLSQWASTMQKAITGVERAVDDYVAEQNVSLNHGVVQKLSDRPPIGPFDL